MKTFDDLGRLSSQRTVSTEPSSNPVDVTQLDDHGVLKEQLNVLTKIEKHFSETDNTDEERETWQSLARVLDRLFLLLYILCFAAVTLVFMLNIINGGS